MAMPRRNPLVPAVFRSGAGVHRRSRTGERQLLDKELDQAVQDWWLDEPEDDFGESGDEEE